MKALFSLASLCFAASLSAATTFGENLDKTTLTSVASVLASPATYLDKEITIAGTVTAVCTKMHCWMTLASDEAESRFRIKVKDGDMVFPLSAKGKTAYAKGIVKVWPQAEGKAEAYQLVPTAVEIAD